MDNRESAQAKPGSRLITLQRGCHRSYCGSCQMASASRSAPKYLETRPRHSNPKRSKNNCNLVDKRFFDRYSETVPQKFSRTRADRRFSGGVVLEVRQTYRATSPFHKWRSTNET